MVDGRFCGLASPRSPWQNGYAERLIGSIRRECLDHVVVLSERHLRHLLLCYIKYYNGARTHLALDKMRRSRAPSIAPGAFFVAQSWADCITNMAGFDLRQAARLALPPTRRRLR
jgi:transposase InsO family protein